MEENKTMIRRIMAALGVGAKSTTADLVTPPQEYEVLKEVFDQVFRLLEIHFEQEHPDKHYLSSALKFRLPQTERIDTAKQEVSFLTYNTLFARSSADYLQRNGLANVSVQVLSEPTKVTLSHLNNSKIHGVYTSTLEHKTEISTPSAPSESFVEREAKRKESTPERSL